MLIECRQGLRGDRYSVATVYTFDIGDIAVGGGRCYVVAEIAQSHDGSLGLAHSYVDAVARAGADAIKFQTHIAAAESTPDEPWRVRFSPQDDTRYDYWERMEFSPDQWEGLRRHADDAGIAFLSSPFSIESADLLERIGVRAWKVASGETTHDSLLERLVATRLPILVSTGMSRLDEIDARRRSSAAQSESLGRAPVHLCLPVPTREDRAQQPRAVQAALRGAVGLSDHSGTIFPSIAATALGLDVVEVHVTMSREMFGPDVPSSVTTAELAQLVEGIRFTEAVVTHPVDKDAMATELHEMRGLFTRSIVAARDLARGATIAPSDLALKKPGTGLPPSRLTDVLGRRLRREVCKDELIAESDVL